MKRKFKWVTYILFILIQLVNIQSVKAESFSWPSTGYLGWIYKSDSGSHTGVDIWSNTDGGWNNDVTGSSNGIYAAYPGDLIWIGTDGIILQHSGNLYTNYWHLKDRQIALWSEVDEQTLMGYQNESNGIVHVHVTVSATSSDSGHINPSSYFGLQLDYSQPNSISWLHSVTNASTSDQCNYPIIQRDLLVVEAGYTYNCSALDSITLTSNVHIKEGANARFYLQ